MAEAFMTSGLFSDQPADNDFAVPAQLISAEEHVALLRNPDRFGSLRRKGDLLDEGVTAVFDLMGEEAELVALTFHADKFTPAVAAKWLAERGFTTLHVTPNSARFTRPVIEEVADNP